MVSMPLHNAPAQSLPLGELLVHAARLVQAVQAGHSLSDEATWRRVPTAARSGSMAITLHTLRRLGVASATVAQHVKRPPPGPIAGLLATAAALLSGDTALPDDAHADALYDAHTVVDQAVHAARKLHAPSAGFVNAVLRQMLRTAPAADASGDEVQRFNHPAWWIDRLKVDWPKDWRDLLTQAHRRAPMGLRLRLGRVDLATYLQQLADAGLSARVLPPHDSLTQLQPSPGPAPATQTLLLDQGVPVQKLPGFAEGHVSVQDAAAQVAAPLLLAGLPHPQVVLDACAAPGGKTAHLLELDPKLHVVAMDQDAKRLARVQDNLNRLGLADRARCVVADASRPDTWPKGLVPSAGFDAVLLDAPCSASGIVRRHPDIVWLRRESDIQTLQRTQAALLDALWPLVKRGGGRLLYATCSIFKAEGAQQVDAFLQRAPHPRPRVDPASPGHWLPLPDNDNSTATHDGFYYALLHRSND